MGVVENERPFFYHKTSQTAIGKDFDGVVTPSGATLQPTQSSPMALLLSGECSARLWRHPLHRVASEPGVSFCLPDRKPARRAIRPACHLVLRDGVLTFLWKQVELDALA
jgi:hypothetical protein